MVAYFKHSMTVVLPLPLWPTMTVTGEKNSITETCLSSKERMPRMASLLRLDMVCLKTAFERFLEARQGVGMQRQR